MCEVHGIMGLLSLLLKFCQADECEDFNYGLMNTKMRRTLHLAQKFGHWTTAGNNGAVRTIVKIWSIYWILSKSKHKTRCTDKQHTSHKYLVTELDWLFIEKKYLNKLLPLLNSDTMHFAIFNGIFILAWKWYVRIHISNNENMHRV